MAMVNKSAMRKNLDIWYLCSFCSRGFLSLTKLTLHKISDHHFTDEEPRPKQAKTVFAKRAPSLDEKKKKSQLIHKAIPPPKDSITRVEKLKQRKLPVKFVAPRKVSRKNKTLHAGLSKRTFLKKVLIRNWLQAITPDLLQQTSLFTKNTNATVTTTTNTFKKLVPPTHPESCLNLENDEEYSKLEQLGNQLNSWLQREASRSSLGTTRTRA